MLGEKSQQSKHLDAAIKDYTKVIPTTNVTSRYAVVAPRERAICYARLKDEYKAIRDIDRVIESSPSNPDLWFYKARIYAILGKEEQTLKALKKALDKGFNDKESGGKTPP